MKIKYEPKICTNCDEIFDGALSYCPSCETYYDNEDEEDIRDEYDDVFNQNQTDIQYGEENS